ncbi:MAG: hypothetical protein HETSPECPRED_004955 [Heterodermia speciosa]|uniref:Uncharacterized protein n=1 Tax=Heterodermia speciosa TaxID=116794 RepID=A0A8H3I5C5_9LECA|nr:MAG: hypothetical protein HETSPECPRED_004955 [Heterodermia speciosa]
MAPSKSQREKNRKEHRPVDKEVRAEFQAVAYQHGTPEQDAAYRAKMLRHKDRHHEKAHKIASGEDTESLATLSRSVTKILAHKYLELFTYDGNHQLNSKNGKAPEGSGLEAAALFLHLHS